MTDPHQTQGVFATYQPRYAEHGIALFPCSTLAKKPLVRNIFKMGLRASTELVDKFGGADAVAFVSGRASKITVLDI